MMSKNQVINEIGEVLETPNFRSIWVNPYGIEGQDLSNEFEEVFTEIEAFAVDPFNGDLLNNKSVPVVKKTGKVNVHEKIQSFANEVDLYHILEKFAYSGDNAIINVKEAGFGDISHIPDNLNDLSLMVNKQFDKIKTINPELADMIVNEKFTAEDIEAKAKEILKSRIDASKVNDSNVNDSKESEVKK